MRRLIRDLFLRYFDSPELAKLADAALLTSNGSRMAFTTDSYVVKPLEFPGGDIGRLCICGTVNDLAVMGAWPQYLSIGLIIEEGLDLRLLERIVASAADTANLAGVKIVTGDTKVVTRGECDGLFINTAGIGACPLGRGLSEQPIEPGDAILVSGTLGDHGVAILNARASLGLDAAVVSDCAPLNGLIAHLLHGPPTVKWMRDPTRGGAASVLIELVDSQSFGVLIREEDIPVKAEVLAVCEILGFDPLHLASEGKVVIVAKGEDARMALQLLKQHPLGRDAAIIGEVTSDGAGAVRLQTASGGMRRLLRPTGELLPRIC